MNNEFASGELKGYLDVRDGNNEQIFKGDYVPPILPLPATINTMTVENPSTNDIPQTGTVMINNVAVKYSSFTRTAPLPAVPERIIFTLAAPLPTPAVATQVTIGEEVDYKGIPYYTKQLNEFVRVFAREFNKIHETGNGGAGAELFSTIGYTGIPLSLDEADDFTYNQITIDNFTCSEKLIDDNSLLFTSSVAGAGESANDLVIKLINLKHDQSMYSKGEPDNFMQSIIGEVGINSKQSLAFSKGQENLINLIGQQRKSISGVDLNEETTDMLKYQQAYNLSAKMMSVMDEIYDVMINQLVR